MTTDPKPSPHTAWAHLRFSIVGRLLSAPPARGELKAEIEALSRKTWRHPTTGKPVRFAAKTIVILAQDRRLLPRTPEALEPRPIAL